MKRLSSTGMRAPPAHSASRAIVLGPYRSRYDVSLDSVLPADTLMMFSGCAPRNVPRAKVRLSMLTAAARYYHQQYECTTCLLCCRCERSTAINLHSHLLVS